MRAGRVGSAIYDLPECIAFVASRRVRRQECRSAMASLSAARTLQRGESYTELRGEPPDRRRLLDVTLHPPPRRRQRARRPAAPSRGGAIIEQLQAHIAPFALVALVADGEIECLQAARDRVAHQFAKMQRAGAEMRKPAVAITRQDVIVAPAMDNAEIRRGVDRTDFDAADMDEMPHRRIGCEIEKEFAAARPREHVGNALARE